MKKILTLFLACYSLVIILLLAVITEPQRVNAGLTSFGLPGIYNQTPLSLTNGDGAALALDYQGRVILSTSTVINASFGNLLPSSNNTYDIGAWGSAWRDVYASGTLRASSTIIAKTGSTLNGGVAGLYLDNDQNAANSLFGIQFQNVGNAGIGKALIVGRTDAADTTNGLSFFVGSNGAMTESLRIDGVTTNVFPGGNNTIDLGAYGNAWKDIYASGTVIGTNITANSAAVSANAIVIDGTNNPAMVLKSSGVVRGYAPVVVTSNDAFYTGSLAGDMGYRSEAGRILFGTGVTLRAFVNNNGFMSGSNNGSDLGAFGNAWKDFYASGTVRISKLNATTTLDISSNSSAAGQGSCIGMRSATGSLYHLIINTSGNLAVLGGACQ